MCAVLIFKALRLAHVNEESHTPHYPQAEFAIPAFTPQLQSVTAMWLYSFPVLLRVRGWVGLGGWMK